MTFVRPPHRMRRAAGAVIALVLAGCSIGSGPDALRKYEPPGHEVAVPGQSWRDAASVSGEKGSTANIWLLPMWMSGRVTEVAADGDSVSSTSFTLANPGLVVIPWLPVWFSADSQLDSRTGERAARSATWSLLFTHTDEGNWPAQLPAVRAWGWPVAYSRITYGPADGDGLFELHNVLWTIGPAWGSANLAYQDKHIDGWWFVPLAAAGLGTVVWTSAHISTQDDEVWMHGPIQGYLGYRSVVDVESDVSYRLILGGALWFDGANATDATTATDTRHGPLWGMFGWGRKDGHSAMTLFWVHFEV
jgi:hypothetical protein